MGWLSNLLGESASASRYSKGKIELSTMLVEPHEVKEFMEERPDYVQLGALLAELAADQPYDAEGRLSHAMFIVGTLQQMRPLIRGNPGCVIFMKEVRRR